MQFIDPSLIGFLTISLFTFHSARVNPDVFLAPPAGVFQVERGEMKTLSFLFLLMASGTCDDVKYISKRNSGRVLSLRLDCSGLVVSLPLGSAARLLFLAVACIDTSLDFSKSSGSAPESKEESLSVVVTRTVPIL